VPYNLLVVFDVILAALALGSYAGIVCYELIQNECLKLTEQNVA
jgi:hypothetical protein